LECYQRFALFFCTPIIASGPGYSW